APAVDTSASGVIARLGPKPGIAAIPPKPPASPVYETPPPAQAAPAQAAQTRPAGSAAQPINFQISVQPTAAQPSPPPAAPSSPPVEPNAVQKLNRSGKGGKLGSPDDALSVGGWQPQQQPSGAGQR